MQIAKKTSIINFYTNDHYISPFKEIMYSQTISCMYAMCILIIFTQFLLTFNKIIHSFLNGDVRYTIMKKTQNLLCPI